MSSLEEFGEYFIISIGIIIFIGFPICALTKCFCCKNKRENIYVEIP